MKHFIERFLNSSVENWHKPALCDLNGDSFVYADVATMIAKMHIVFRKVGIKPGDKIALCGKNCAKWGIGYLSAISYRAVAVPIMTGFTPDTLQTLVNHSDSVFMFTESKIWRTLDPGTMPKLTGVLSIDDFSHLYSADDHLSTVIPNLDSLFRKKYPQGMKRRLFQDEVEIAGDDDLCTISYTSGTTSSPKGIMLSSKNISSNINFGVERISLQRNSHMLSMLPLAHLYGLAFEFIYPLAQGCAVYFLGKTPTPTVLMNAFSKVRPYMLITVPLVLEKIIQKQVLPVIESNPAKTLLRIPIINDILRKKIRDRILDAFGGNIHHIIVGGAAISGTIEILLRQIKLPYTIGYGMTECGPLIGYEDWYNFAFRSCGKPVRGMEVRIDSSNPQKEVGEIQVKGDNVMIGYYKNEEVTRQTFTADGWMRTGDLGLVDRYGNIFIKGRSKNMILTSNGQNIYPEEIEELLNAMPHVKESIVINRDKRIIAIVSVENDEVNPLSHSEIQTIMKSNIILLNRKLPSYSQVSDFEVLPDDFERTPKNSIKRFIYN